MPDSAGRLMILFPAGILTSPDYKNGVLMRIPALILMFLVVMTAACDRNGQAIKKDYPVSKVTAKVYVIHGPNEYPNQTNQAFMNNPGFVLVRNGVVVVDPGSSLQVGEMVLRKITSITRDPVIAVFNTHVHGDHWLGNDAIRRAYPKAVIYAHPKMIEKSQTAGEFWINLFNQMTDNAVKGTQAVFPVMGLENEDVLTLNGMHFRAYHTGHAHTDGDLMIEVVEEKVMFTGDNVMAMRTGRMDDGHFTGNIKACEVALKSSAEHFIPGHGPSNGRQIVSAYRDWLTALVASVKKYHAQGLADFEMKPKVVADLNAYQGWATFDSEIGKLISLVILQLEQESF